MLGLAPGYEDLNDHDTLRHDALLAAVVGKADPTGASRVRAADRGSALAGKSTLNRLELAGPRAQTDRYKKVSYDAAALDALLVDLFIEAHPRPPVRIVLDVDATDDPLHGQQEGRFFHGYYRHYCYLPLYVFCDAHVLWCARQTGEGWPVKVRRKEGVTNHLHPESCAGRCEAAGEALTGARTGRAIEHRKRGGLERRDYHSGRRPHRHHRAG